MDDEFLKKLKKSYLKTEVPTYLKEDGWDDLEKKLDEPVKHHSRPIFYNPYAFASLLILLIGALIYGTLSSKPNSPAHTVKQATEHTVNQIENNPQSEFNIIATPSAMPTLKATPTPTPTATPATTPTPVSSPKTMINTLDNLIQQLIPENQNDNHGENNGQKNQDQIHGNSNNESHGNSNHSQNNRD